MDDDDYARRFAIEHAGYADDLDFWRRSAHRAGSRVLDLGSATGRLALPLARDGHEVWALDRSEAMLDELRRRVADEPPEVRDRIRTVRAALDDFRLDARFGLVLVAMNTLQVLLRPEERRRCFRSIARHLAPRGELVFDVALPDREEIVSSLGVERDGLSYLDPATGSRIAQSAWYEDHDPESGTLSFVIRVRDLDGPEAGAERLRRHTVHLYSRDEIAELVADTGLRVVGVYGDFAGRPLTARSERQIYRCVLSGSAA